MTTRFDVTLSKNAVDVDRVLKTALTYVQQDDSSRDM